MICSYSSLIVLGLIFLVSMQSSYTIIWQNLVIADLYFEKIAFLCLTSNLKQCIHPFFPLQLLRIDKIHL